MDVARILAQVKRLQIVASRQVNDLLAGEYASMFKDLSRPGPLSLRLKHLWGPPEWERPAIAPELDQQSLGTESHQQLSHSS